jgi:hypothetical protein
MHIIKTTLVTLTAATLLFIVWVSILVHRLPEYNHSKTFGMGLVYTPLVQVWFWAAVLAVGGLYYRFSK